jgi:hypothetical protein
MKSDTFGLDPKEVQKQDEEAAQVERDNKVRLSDMRKILSLAEGRRYVWYLLEKCGVYTQSFSLNTLQMAHNEGQRFIGIALLSDVELAKPGTVNQMMSEAMSKKNSAKIKEKQDGS